VADLLVVEDDPDLGELLCGLLEDRGHHVRVGRDGVEGLALVRAHQPDLLLLDVEMPRLTGPEVAFRMFLHDVGEDKIPIVLLSGVTTLARVADLVGTPYFLPKPYGFEEVDRIITKALRERRAPVPKSAREAAETGR
jgi:DNA-binding response OmpR family regulator